MKIPWSLIGLTLANSHVIGTTITQSCTGTMLMLVGIILISCIFVEASRNKEPCPSGLGPDLQHPSVFRSTDNKFIVALLIIRCPEHIGQTTKLRAMV